MSGPGKGGADWVSRCGAESPVPDFQMPGDQLPAQEERPPTHARVNPRLGHRQGMALVLGLHWPRTTLPQPPEPCSEEGKGNRQPGLA